MPGFESPFDNENFSDNSIGNGKKNNEEEIECQRSPNKKHSWSDYDQTRHDGQVFMKQFCRHCGDWREIPDSRHR